MAEEEFVLAGKRAERETEGEAEEPASAKTKEVEEIKVMIEETQTWFQEQTKVMEGQPKNVDAPFRAIDLDLRGSKLQRKVLRLMNRKPPKAQAKKSTASPAPSQTEATTEPSPEESRTPHEDL